MHEDAYHILSPIVWRRATIFARTVWRSIESHRQHSTRCGYSASLSLGAGSLWLIGLVEPRYDVEVSKAVALHVLVNVSLHLRHSSRLAVQSLPLFLVVSIAGAKSETLPTAQFPPARVSNIDCTIIHVRTFQE